MSAIRQHAFEACNHPGNHGYGPNPPICETCRNGEGDKAHVVTVEVVPATLALSNVAEANLLADALDDYLHGLRRFGGNPDLIKVTRSLADRVDAVIVAGFTTRTCSFCGQQERPSTTCLNQKTVHTVRGKPIGPEGSPYGVTHDYDCPGCEGTSYTASPRSETYWSS